MNECTHEWSKGKLNCPYCEIDRLNKEINRLRQYEDAITSAIDGTLLVWNLMSTNHTVIKNDYWQNHLEEIDRLKAELGDVQTAYDELRLLADGRLTIKPEYVKGLERQLDASQALLAEARAEIERLSSPDYYACAMCPDIKQARQEAARECIEAIETEYGILGLAYTLRQRYGLEG